jgi:KTSC domain
MQLVTVESSMIHAVGYDKESQELEVVYTSGKIWRYTSVPEQIYRQLLAADSKGSFMKACIIGMYPEYKVSRRRS